LIPITRSIAVDESEIEETFVCASGPGGQKVNTTATAVKLRFDVAHSPSLPEDVRRRLIRMARNRITEEGILVIDARRFGTQKQNRRDARNRLADLIRRASRKPKLQRRTRPPAESKRRRLEQKKRRAEIKRLRKPSGEFI
jgi:ribosome-associated protein